MRANKTRYRNAGAKSLQQDNTVSRYFRLAERLPCAVYIMRFCFYFGLA